MVEWITVIGLILFGLALVLIEIIFIPGTTFVGLIGLSFAGFGIYFSYDYFGNSTGTAVLISFSLVSVAAFVISIRSGVWKRFALRKTITSKVNEGQIQALQVGEKGTSISALRPIGKAEFGDQVYEVTTSGNYLEAGLDIEITRIEKNKIIVEPVKQ